MILPNYVLSCSMYCNTTCELFASKCVFFFPIILKWWPESIRSPCWLKSIYSSMLSLCFVLFLPAVLTDPVYELLDSWNWQYPAFCSCLYVSYHMLMCGHGHNCLLALLSVRLGLTFLPPFDSFLGPTGPPSTLPLSTQTSSGSSTLSKKRPPPPPPGHKRTLSDPPSPLPHGPQNKGAVPWGKSSYSQGQY